MYQIEDRTQNVQEVKQVIRCKRASQSIGRLSCILINFTSAVLTLSGRIYTATIIDIRAIYA